jgi:hypothetical protein
MIRLSLGGVEQRWTEEMELRFVRAKLVDKRGPPAVTFALEGCWDDSGRSQGSSSKFRTQSIALRSELMLVGATYSVTAGSVVCEAVHLSEQKRQLPLASRGTSTEVGRIVERRPIPGQAKTER